MAADTATKRKGPTVDGDVAPDRRTAWRESLARRATTRAGEAAEDCPTGHAPENDAQEGGLSNLLLCSLKTRQRGAGARRGVFLCAVARLRNFYQAEVEADVDHEGFAFLQVGRGDAGGRS